MEQHGTFPIDDMNLRPGQNFYSKLNCYIDGKRSRILGPGAPGYKTLNKSLTFMHYAVAIIWAPLGMVLSLAIWVICCPCCYCAASRVRHKKKSRDRRRAAGCCGCCSSNEILDCSFASVLIPFKGVMPYEDTIGDSPVNTNIHDSQTPGLEAGCWVQFMMNHQQTWWGYVNLRWEWRLASLIPSDVYGASMETTIADLQLLAALAGMTFSDSQYIPATALCGEQITFSQHGSLGLMAYYRSNRENIQQRIILNPPKIESSWLYGCIEACRRGQLDVFQTIQQYSDVKI